DMRWLLTLFAGAVLVRPAGAGVPADTAWTGRGLLVSGDVNSQVAPALVRSSDGAYFVGWQDGRYVFDEPDIFAQKLLPDGTRAPGWIEGGRPFALIPGRQIAPVIASDEAGGVLAVWEDY